jgi:hypothetical protein
MSEKMEFEATIDKQKFKSAIAELNQEASTLVVRVANIIEIGAQALGYQLSLTEQLVIDSIRLAAMAQREIAASLATNPLTAALAAAQFMMALSLEVQTVQAVRDQANINNAELQQMRASLQLMGMFR